jgi:hypothetical protein
LRSEALMGDVSQALEVAEPDVEDIGMAVPTEHKD